MLQRLLLAALRRSARANQSVLRRHRRLRTAARLHRRTGRAGTRLGPSHHRQLLRRRATGNDPGPWLHRRRGAPARHRSRQRPLEAPLRRRPGHRRPTHHPIGPPFHRGWRGAVRLPRSRHHPRLPILGAARQPRSVAAQHQQLPIAQLPLDPGRRTPPPRRHKPTGRRGTRRHRPEPGPNLPGNGQGWRFPFRTRRIAASARPVHRNDVPRRAHGGGGAGPRDRLRQRGQSTPRASLRPSTRDGRAPRPGRHTRALDAPDVNGKPATGARWRIAGRCALVVGYAGSLRFPHSRARAARSQCRRRLARAALHVRAQCRHRPAIRTGPGVGGRAPHPGKRVEGRGRAGASRTPLDFAQRAGCVAGRHVAGAPLRHRTLPAQPRKRLQHGRRLSLARDSDHVRRSSRTWVHRRAHRAVPCPIATARGRTSGCGFRCVYRRRALVGRTPERRFAC